MNHHFVKRIGAALGLEHFALCSEAFEAPYVALGRILKYALVKRIGAELGQLKLVCLALELAGEFHRRFFGLLAPVFNSLQAVAHREHADVGRGAICTKAVYHRNLAIHRLLRHDTGCDRHRGQTEKN